MRVVVIDIPTTPGDMAVVALRFKRTMACLALLAGASLCAFPSGETS